MTALARKHRDLALYHIQQAQKSLSAALDAASPLRGWAEDEPRGPYYLIGDTYDEVKKLWRRVSEAPMPTTHDSEPE